MKFKIGDILIPQEGVSVNITLLEIVGIKKDNYLIKVLEDKSGAFKVGKIYTFYKGGVNEEYRSDLHRKVNKVLELI